MLEEGKAIKVASIVGARPQFIKAAPVSRVIKRYNEEAGPESTEIEEIIVHTGQHYDESMSKVFFDELNIPKPDYNLGVGSESHGAQTGRMLERVERVLLKEKTDVVLVYGDTNSTLAGALAAVKLHIPVGHVEAGLRSYNRAMPEEINRVLTDHIAELLFCPTETAVENLKREGITEGIHNVGDVMYDSVLYNAKLAEQSSTILESLGARCNLQGKGYFLATVHRAENTDNLERLREIFAAFIEIANKEAPVVCPLHPRTQRALPSLDFDSQLSVYNSGLKIIDPVSYLDMLILEKKARAILTDSGGVQKEAFFFQVPCVTLRDETEWMETVESGWNRLAGADKEEILRSVGEMSRSEGKRTDNPYGDGRAAEKVAELLLNFSQISRRLIKSKE